MRSSTTRSRYAISALLLCMLGVVFPAQAQQQGSRFTAAEIAGLPQYCQDKLNPDGDKERWVGVFGRENWLHHHHFCYGLIFFARATSELNSKRRRENAQYGIGEFNYVLGRWPANFPLHQQAQMYKQQLEMMAKWN